MSRLNQTGFAMKLYYLIIGSVLLMNVAVSADERYREPPQVVVDIIDAAPTPGVSFSPDRKWLAFIDRDAMPSIADVSRRMLRLAGMRIDPQANSRFMTSYVKSIRLRRRDGGKEVMIPLPAGTRISGTRWAHDSQRLAITTVTDKGTQLWVVDVDQPAEPKMLTDRLSTVMGSVNWMPDAKHLICQLVPADRGDEPQGDLVPTGPNVQESSGNKSPTRTYQDLLQNPHDEAMFEYFASNELVLLGVDGSEQRIGEKAIYGGVSPSPDGKHLLLTIVKHPFSYLMTVRSFPQSVEVWDLAGKREHLVVDIPMAENIPIEGVRMGPRSIDWMSSRNATLAWTEALDGGDPNKEAEHRDQIMTLNAPFSDAPKELTKVEHRAVGMSYMQNPAQVVITEYDRDRRWVRTSLHDFAQPNTTPRVLMDRSVRDRYGDPGSIVQVSDASGHTVALQRGDSIFRTGSGASPKGNLPFLDVQDLTSLETKRVWRCEEGTYESAVAIIPAEGDSNSVSFITSSETKTTPLNFFLRSADGQRTAITDFKDPTPQIRGIKKELVTYKRKDGVPLSATLYLPADYKEGTRLPLLVWAYPREFNDVKTAAQISGSPWRFTRMGSISHLTLLTQGYAIMDAATMPVIGDPETMNDTFIEQIVDSAQAAIDYAVERGVADRNRVGVGGHSYGAFMTANLLAHCDLFNAGIARSGAYNRTLTPFGFQSERRSFWDAKEIYYSISPFMHANKIKAPLLMTHGEEDNNSGTFPVQSKRMYQAIKGNGGTVRLVMLPAESHGYRARESVLHVQAEMIEWFDKYLKNAK